MKFSAKIKNSKNLNIITLESNGEIKELKIPSKLSGFGSYVNGGELLLLSLATCFCNDLYREANKMNLAISEIEITADGDFRAEGEPGSNFKCLVKVKSNESPLEIDRLITHTDQVAEILKTLRNGTTITLAR
jgi:organic hydroperoxide reductase OsmC/OhrA